MIRLLSVDGLVPALTGVVLGVAIGLAAAGVLRTMLFGISPFDAMAFVGGSGTVTVVAVLSVALSMRRTGSVDPATTLREE